MYGVWPTDATSWLLIIGLVPVISVTYLAFLAPKAEGFSLRFWAVTVTWAAYHASPFLHYFFGLPWNSWPFQMSEGYVDTALLFSTICSVTMLIGYSLTGPKRPPSLWQTVALLTRMRLPASVMFLVFAAFVVAFVLGINGISELWIAREARGAFEWMERDLWWNIRHLAMVATKMLSPILATLATLYALQDGSNKAFRWSIALLIIVGSMLPAAHGFSRTVGLPLVIFGTLAINLRGNRMFVPSTAAIVLGLYLSMVALTQRGSYDLGLCHFLDATQQGLVLDPLVHQNAFDLGVVNPIRAIERFTVKLEIGDVEQYQASSLMSAWLWNLQPFPSVIVPLRPVGMEPTEYLGLTNVSGVPAPVMAELYFVFGYLGCFATGVMGMIYGWFDRLRARQPGIITAVCYFICLASIGASTHAGSRPWTRYTLYAAVFYITAQCLLHLKTRRTNSAPHRVPSPGAIPMRHPQVSLMQPRVPGRRAAGEKRLPSVLRRSA